MNPFSSFLHSFASELGYWLTHGWPFLVAAFLVGSIPFGLVVGRVFFKTDIRASGSGNIGAANALRTFGRGAGAAVLALDALKGVAASRLPVLALHRGWVQLPAGFFYRHSAAHDIDSLAWLCGLAAVVGHCYSPWLRFKGGKGVATFLGVLIGLDWPSALVFAGVWLAIVLPTGFASLGSILGTLGAIAFMAVSGVSGAVLLMLPAAAIIIWKHRENISRLLAGRENRLNLLKR